MSILTCLLSPHNIAVRLKQFACGPEGTEYGLYDLSRELFHKLTTYYPDKIVGPAARADQ